MPISTSRFEDVSRRAFLRRSLIVGAVVAIPGLACSSDDKNTFSSTTSNASTAPAPTTSDAGAAGTTDTVAPASTASTAASPASPATNAGTSAATAADGGTFPAGGSVVVNFTYAASGGGRINNPYIAVWVEDAQGELVKTISLWYKQRESKYLNELQRRASVENAASNGGVSDPYDTVSGATRVAGDYSVQWDGTGIDGAPVALGDYFVCVEAAREHGPYELVRGQVTLDGAATTADLGTNGESTAASVAITV